MLPAICGRVCPQEKQCESRCIYHKMKKEPVAIGYLERFAADSEIARGATKTEKAEPNGIRVAVAGSGPAGLSFAGAMARMGFEVDVFEALHEVGGVLKYGIPEFRLPNSVVDAELDALRAMGIRFHTDVIIGKTITYDELLSRGYRGIFVASGAGLPRFMGVPGENFCGVLSSNEYLTRINLMGAGRDGHDTPAPHGRRVAVIGGGNTAMDSVRTARRMGAEKAMIIYRRSEAEMPARAEEVLHAREEGVEFVTLANPVEYLADDRGHVRAVRVQRMRLGEPDASGRRRPVPVEGEVYDLPTDLAIVALGTRSNPILLDATPDLEQNKWGYIQTNEETGETSIPNVFAGGDIVTGAATVILAMGAGRRAGQEIVKRLLA